MRATDINCKLLFATSEEVDVVADISPMQIFSIPTQGHQTWKKFSFGKISTKNSDGKPEISVGGKQKRFKHTFFWVWGPNSPGGGARGCLTKLYRHTFFMIHGGPS